MLQARDGMEVLVMIDLAREALIAEYGAALEMLQHSIATARAA